jgi:phage baseplate assembly protein W
MIAEMNHLFATLPSGLETYSGQSAIAEKFENWISTPKGSFLGRPNWGHTLRQFLHEPPTDTLAMLIEAELVETLSKDMPLIQIVWVRAKPAFDYDGYSLSVGYRVLDNNSLIEGTLQNDFKVGES